MIEAQCIEHHASWENTSWKLGRRGRIERVVGRRVLIEERRQVLHPTCPMEPSVPIHRSNLWTKPAHNEVFEDPSHSSPGVFPVGVLSNNNYAFGLLNLPPSLNTARASPTVRASAAAESYGAKCRLSALPSIRCSPDLIIPPSVIILLISTVICASYSLS